MGKVYGRVAAASTVALAVALSAAPATAKKIENSYICVFEKGKVGKGAERRAAQAAANANGGNVKHVYTNTVRGFATNISAQGAARMQAANPNIAYCEQDQTVSTVAPPPGKGKNKNGGDGGGGGDTTETTPWGVARVGGGLSGATGRAFVLDSGVDLDHPDLNVNTSMSRSFTSERNADDGNGHGTHVAGTIAAIRGNGGLYGVAAGAEIVAVKVLTRSGSGSTSGVIAGVDYVAQVGRNGDVANMSLGGGVSTTLDNAVIAAAATGVKFVLAAGNEAQDANNSSPARANGPNVFTVSSFAQGDNWSSFSNFGNPPIDYAAPGSSILSTYKGGGYATLSGTSMAAPHIAGLLLLGPIRSGGTVNGDPDGKPDTIGIN